MLIKQKKELHLKIGRHKLLLVQGMSAKMAVNRTQTRLKANGTPTRQCLVIKVAAILKWRTTAQAKS